MQRTERDIVFFCAPEREEEMQLCRCGKIAVNMCHFCAYHYGDTCAADGTNCAYTCDQSIK